MRECAEPGHLLSVQEGASKEVTLRAGDLVFFEYHRHYSVGIDCEFEIGDSLLLELLRSEHEYVHPERLKPGWTGGDNERCRWVFKTLHKGKTTLTIRKMFRGATDATYVYEINIT